MYQYPHYPQYPQYPPNFNFPSFPSFGATYPPPNPPQAVPQVPQGPHDPPPENYYAFTRETLLQVLEKLSLLIETEFRRTHIRLVAHGGACVLLHSALHDIADRRATHSGFLLESQRFTTRDVDYIHRSFVKEYEQQQGIPSAGERLKRCIHETAVQMGHEFGLGDDWMNSEADNGLPWHEDTGRYTDPVYEASITPSNTRYNTVYVSKNKMLTIVCIPAAWAVALKLHRFSLKDSSDICLWLILESKARSAPWDVESVKQWLERECPDMNYRNFDRQRLVQRRERIERVLAILSTTNNGALEYNIDQVQAFLPNGKTGIQPPGAVLPDPRPVSTDRFQIGSRPDPAAAAGWHPNPNHMAPVGGGSHLDHGRVPGYPRNDPQFFAGPPMDMKSGSMRVPEGHRNDNSHSRSSRRHARGRSQLSPPDTDSDESETDSDSDDISDSSEGSDEYEPEPNGPRRRASQGILRDPMTSASSGVKRNVTIQEPPPEIMSIEEETAKQMARMVVHDRAPTPFDLDSSSDSDTGLPPLQRHSRLSTRQYSSPLPPSQNQNTSQSGWGSEMGSRPSSSIRDPRRQYSTPLSQPGQMYHPNENYSGSSGSHSRASTSNYYHSNSRHPSPNRHGSGQRTASPESLFIPPLPANESRDPYQRSWGTYDPHH
ncbi:hypothetical protein K435DRAFT_83152 [Dendrothele bispora CBS 962.96]|uniref:Uncharacterized protein n=1 Tax=Dendrothele bispora (strain CBS 962.96) TaxID=1314807 RepID=A0A4S8M3Q1_DENBC|nr:hypothetical protein K435DRAFT_83152 [Dendrothele bispora CBS 962.96]